MNQEKTPSQIEPMKFGPESRFQFKCHKGLSCFTQCCSGINIILTPYDIIRLKNRLALSSDDFLALYTQPQILEKTGLPVVTLKLLNDETSSCPFVTEDGCFVYSDRPVTCRYYPLGVAALSHRENPEDEFYFFVNEPHCRGFEEKKEWTVREWRKNQQADEYDKINAPWVDLIVRKRSFPPNMMLTEQTKQMFFLASYNIDKFREFVFESSFMDRYDIDAETVARIKKDELELLSFGFEWLTWLLFKKGDFKLKAQEVQ